MSGETDIIRILLVEDDPAFASTLHERLSGPEAPAADIVQVGLIVDAVAELTTSPFDLVLLDPGIPDGFGAGAFARIRTAAPDVPVLILADREDELVALKAVHAGAVDYFLKDQITDLLLSRVIRYAVERSRADGAMRRVAEENDRLAAAVSELSTGVVITDPNAAEHPIVFANGGFLRMTGYSLEEVMGRTLRFLEGPDTDPVAVAEIRQALAARRQVKTVLLHYRKDGTPFWNEVSVTPVFNALGQLIHYVWLQTDVSARIDAERELASRNRELATLHRISEISLSAVSPERAFDAIVEEIAKATEFPIVTIELYDEARERMVYRAARGIPLPQGGRPLNVPLDATLSAHVVRTGEPVVVTSGLGTEPGMRDEVLEALGVQSLIRVPMISGRKVIGTLTLADRAARPIASRLPRFASSLASFIASLVERTRAQEALAAEGERLSVTLRSIAEGVVATDRRGRITLMNRVAEQLSGWPQEEAMGRPLDEVFRLVDERRRTPVDPINRVLKGDRADVTAKGSGILHSRTGEEFIVAHSAAPLLGRTGAVVGAVLVFRDITRDRQIEEELLKASKLDSLGTLAGGIAHDFNNLLTGILGHLSLLRSDPASEDAKEAVAEAEEAARRAKSLTQQLLTFSRGGAPIRKPASLAAIVRESARVALHGSGIACEVSIPDELKPVEIDEGQIGQVLGNLLINAQEAMRDGGTVHVTCCNVEVDPRSDGDQPALPLEPGSYVCVSIRDEGTGIAPEHLPKIFDPYFSTRPNASGLGLAAAYSIVRKHGGHIGVQSVPGQGATFDIYLPALETPPEEQGHTAGPVAKGLHRILVMDDDGVVLGVVRRMLERLGYAVDTVTDGQSALARYREALEAGSPYHVVLMDLTIPGGMGGRETIGKLLEIDPEARAIVSSGYSNDPVMAEYRAHGFRAVMAKPYDMRELRRTVESVIAGAPLESVTEGREVDSKPEIRDI